MKLARFKNLKFLIFILAFLMLLPAVNNYGIWTDEAYTLNKINMSFKEIFITENSFDGSLVYFIMLKLFYSVTFFSSPKHLIIVSRIFSIIPIAVLLIVGWLKIRKNYDNISAISFVFLMFSGNILNYSIEIRVYAWCILFTTLAYLEYLEIYNGKHNVMWFVGFSSGAFWLHKVSILPLSILYLFWFIKSLETRQIMRFIKYLFLTVILCMPIVLYTILMNLNTPSLNYSSGAINPIFSLNKIKESIVFPYDTGYLYLSLFCLLLFAILILDNLLHKKKDFSIMAGWLSTPFTIVGLMLLAYFTNHDYYPKYMLPSLGILLTSLSLIIGKNKFKYYLIAFFALTNFIGYFNFYYNEYKAIEGFKKFEQYFYSNLNNEETVVCNFDYGKIILDYYQFDNLKDNKIIWEEEFHDKKDNAVYFIQTSKLSQYFKDNYYEVIEEFNISNDMFSLCLTN